jgi:outer membrane lipoprotein SlyB
MNTLESRSPRSKLAPMALKAFYFIGMAAIVGWSLPKADPAAPAGPRAESAMQVQVPDGGAPATAVEAPASVQSPRNARSRVNCDGCGVIESVRRIDTRDEIMEWCTIGNITGTRVPGNPIGSDERAELASLADMAAGVIDGDRRARKFRVTTRHQIVVRLRDGSRQVFDENSPRTLHEGERVNVIAGSTAGNG